MVTAEGAPELTSTLRTERKEHSEACMFRRFKVMWTEKRCAYPPMKEINRKVVNNKHITVFPFPYPM